MCRLSIGTHAALRNHRPWVIGLAVLSAALVGVLAVIVLYHRSSREEAYTNIIYVWGLDDSWNGAKVIVTGNNLRFVDQITEKQHLSCRFHVPAGDYTVSVEKNGRTLAAQEQSAAGLQPHLVAVSHRLRPLNRACNGTRATRRNFRSSENGSHCQATRHRRWHWRMCRWKCRRAKCMPWSAKMARAKARS